MMQKLGIFLIMVMCLYTGAVTAQNKDIKEDAAYYFDGKDYKKAYELYDKLSAQNPTNMEYKFRLGFCTLKYPDKKARAIELFTDIKKTDKSYLIFIQIFMNKNHD